MMPVMTLPWLSRARNSWWMLVLLRQAVGSQKRYCIPDMIFTDRASCEECGSGPPNYTILQTLHYGYHLCYSNLRPQLSSPLFTHVYCLCICSRKVPNFGKTRDLHQTVLILAGKVVIYKIKNRKNRLDCNSKLLDLYTSLYCDYIFLFSDPSRWPRGTIYPQKLALTSPTSGCRSVGIVRSRAQATEFSFSIFYIVYIV
jgi:hypothetical protein